MTPAFARDLAAMGYNDSPAARAERQDNVLTSVRVTGPEGSYVVECACLRWARDMIAKLPEGWFGTVIYSPETDEEDEEAA